MRTKHREYYGKFGSIFFVTTTVLGFVKIFQYREIAKILIDILSYNQNNKAYTILAYVIMPHHIHLVLKTNHRMSIRNIMDNIMRTSSVSINEYIYSNNMKFLINKLENESESYKANPRLWNPRFDCLVVRGEKTLIQKINYIHNNPLKQNYVENPADWEFSSAANYAGVSDCALEVDTDWKCIQS